ncbi:hypothetical protein ACFZDJ_52735 [Streptomyces sp. NPDC007896]|uniref:hypothetical protein n=1 Tax=Streptomyces sp. NPDC007896 TaxID=3364784 RepID=UPI0036ED3461
MLAVLRAYYGLRASRASGVEGFDGLLAVVGGGAGVEEMDGADAHGVAVDGDFEARRADAQALGLWAEDGPEGGGVVAVESDRERAGGPVSHAAAPQ